MIRVISSPVERDRRQDEDALCAPLEDSYENIIDPWSRS